MVPQNDWSIVNGKLIPTNEPAIPVSSRGLMYGDGVFETIRIYEGRTLYLEKHIQRLVSGLEFLGISFPHNLKKEQLRSLLNRLLKKNDLLQSDAIIRFQVWRDGQRGYATTNYSEAQYAVMASACPREFEMPKLSTVNYKRIPDEALPSAYKFTNGLNYILAAREAGKQNADDALLQTINGYVSETTIANIFWVKNKQIYTPSVDCDLLPGITRNIIIQLAEEESIPVNEGQFTLEHLLTAEAVWLTNSVRELLPVRQVDSKSYKADHPVISTLMNRFVMLKDDNLNPL